LVIGGASINIKIEGANKIRGASKRYQIRSASKWRRIIRYQNKRRLKIGGASIRYQNKIPNQRRLQRYDKIKDASNWRRI
jgi:hypothetical protein